MEPPGWIHDVAPASIAEIKPSAKGNIASLATELPSKDRPASPAFQIAIRHESTLDICPAPIPNVLSLPLKTIAFDLTCLQTLHANFIASISSTLGGLLVLTFSSIPSRPKTLGSASITKSPPGADLITGS